MSEDPFPTRTAAKEMVRSLAVGTCVCIGVTEGIGGSAGEWGRLIRKELGRNHEGLHVGRDHHPKASGPVES